MVGSCDRSAPRSKIQAGKGRVAMHLSPRPETGIKATSEAEWSRNRP